MGKVEIVFDGDGTRLMRTLAQMDRKYSESLENMGRKTQKTFGDKGLERIKRFALQFGSIAAAVQAASAAMQVFDERSRSAMDRMMGARQAAANLVQMADTPQDMARLEQASSAFANVAGVPIGQAMGSVFSLRSAGVPFDQIPTFAEAERIGFDAGSSSAAAAALRSTMGPDETGTFRDIFSKSIAASKRSPSLPGPILEGAAQTGVMASMLGFSDEEMLAAMAVLSTSTNSPEQGSTRLRAILKSMVGETDRFKGKTFLQGLQDIQAHGIGDTGMIRKKGRDPLKPEGLQQGFGRVEGFLGFGTIQANVPAFQEALEAIQAAETSDLFGQRLDVAESSTFLRTANELASSEQELARARQALGVMRGQGRAARNRRQLMRELGGVSGQIESAAVDTAIGVLPGAAEGLIDTTGADRLSRPGEVAAEALLRNPVVLKIISLLGGIEENTKGSGSVGLTKPGED